MATINNAVHMGLFNMELTDPERIVLFKKLSKSNPIPSLTFSPRGHQIYSVKQKTQNQITQGVHKH